MTNISARLTMEFDRLLGRTTKDSPAQGIGTVRLLINCPHAPGCVLEKAKSVMVAVNSAALNGWPANGHASPVLPEWFTSACASDRSKEEADRWLTWWKGLSYEEKQRADSEENWSLANWLYWLEPENRHWFWWKDFIQKESNQIVLTIEVEGWPFSWEALGWLFHAAGASGVAPEE